jgi:hypothetical protein
MEQARRGVKQFFIGQGAAWRSAAFAFHCWYSASRLWMRCFLAQRLLFAVFQTKQKGVLAYFVTDIKG